MTVPPASPASTGRAPSSVVTVKWPPSDCVTVTRVPGSVTVDPLGIRVASQSRARAMDPLFSSGRLDDLYDRPSDSGGLEEPEQRALVLPGFGQGERRSKSVGMLTVG